jgi:hypothetical protein
LVLELLADRKPSQTNIDSETQKTKRPKTQKENERESVPVLTIAAPLNLMAGVKRKKRRWPLGCSATTKNERAKKTRSGFGDFDSFPSLFEPVVLFWS